MTKPKMTLLLSVLWICTALTAQESHDTMVEYQKARKAMGQQEYDQAILKFKEIIQNRPEFLRACRSLVRAYAAKHDTDGAIGFFKSQMGMKTNPGCRHYGLGYAFELKEQYKEALDQYKKALDLVPYLQETYDGFVDISVLLGRQNPDLLIESEKFIKQLIERDTSNACPYQGLGYLYLRQYKWNKALELYDRALQKKADFWQVFHDKAHVYWQLGQYQKSLDMLKVEFELAIKADDSEVMSKAIGNMGAVYSYLDDYQNALFCQQRSLSIAEEIGDQRGIGSIFGNIGFIYYKMGNYDKAMDFYQRALDKHREVKNRFSEGLILENLSTLYSDLGDYEKAFIYDENALKIHQEIGNRKSEGIALGNIGVDHFHLGHFEKSVEYYRKALEIHRSLKNRRSEGIILEHIGTVFLQQKNYDKAKDYLFKALAIDRDIGNKENEGLVCIELGDLYFDTKEFQRSDSCYQNALQIGQRFTISGVVWKAYKRLGMLRETQNRFTDALSYYRLAIQEIEKLRDHVPTEQFKMEFFEDKIEVYAKLVRLLDRLHQKNPDKKYAEESFRYAEMSKARTFLESLCLGPSFFSSLNIDQDLKDKLLVNRRIMEKKYAELSDELDKEVGAQNEKLILKLNNDIEQLQRQEQELLNELRSNYPGYYQLTHPEIVDSEKIMRTILKPDQILIEYMVGSQRTYVWIITRQSIEFKSISLNRTQIEDMLNAASPLFSQRRDSMDVQIDHRWANVKPEPLHAMYRYLLEEPAGKYLQKGKELIIVPDNVLFYFPFEILVTDGNGNKVRYLIERHPVSYAYSASLLNPELRQEGRAERDLLAFGNPDFDREQGNGILDWVRSTVSLKSIFRNNRFEPLPNAETEVKTIANYFDAPAVYTGREATEKLFKRIAGQFRFIHLATHYLTSDGQPMYSKIVLSQSDEETEDGYLQTYEIVQLRLNADLVVLSGCNTGLGKLTRGEGLMGMTRAFLHAGVPSVVVSLWPVEDLSSSKFMAAFYRGLKAGLKKNLALQQAKIDMIRSTDSKRDPFYWGPFVLIGDSR